MRLTQDGPEIPDDLIRAHDKGDTLFLCGAGVSMRAGLPGFRDLVKAVYRDHHESWTAISAEREAMDRCDYELVLNHLQRRLGNSIRQTVARELSSANAVNGLSSHLTLLQLCRYDLMHPRLLTTNFDQLFERAWELDEQDPIPIHVREGIPRQKTPTCTGILYLHGRVTDPPDGPAIPAIVLTSDDFARAYMTERWTPDYLYDAVRAHNLVLVGYSAQDPLVRYLMRGIEVDRERLGGLKTIHAFAPCDPGSEDVTIPRWRELGVDPILYDPADDHHALYESMDEWKRYLENPRGWRQQVVAATFARPPSDVSDNALARALGILRYEDPTSLLGDISPAPDWLGELSGRDFFHDEDISPALWIANRLDDLDMIQSCAGLEVLDRKTVWTIGQDLRYGGNLMTPMRRKVWHLIVRTKRPLERFSPSLDWHDIDESLERGDSDYHVRRSIAELLRPTLAIRSPYWFLRSGESHAERLWDYLRPDHVRKPYPGSSAVLRLWPDTVSGNGDLIRILTRTIDDALEEAADVGLETSRTVPSVAPHHQNRLYTGFLPITRVIAETWSRLMALDQDQGRQIVKHWHRRPHMLFTRLVLFAYTHESYTGAETGSLVCQLDNSSFWNSEAQVELMRLLVAKWTQIGVNERVAIEERWCSGVPRSCFVDDAFESEEEWQLCRDNGRFRRLSRMVSGGLPLSADPMQALSEIRERRGWDYYTDERADFSTWSESGMGPQGNPELLANVSASALLAEVWRLQKSDPFKQGGLWEIICATDPQRALSALDAAPGIDDRNGSAWSCLLSVTTQSARGELTVGITARLLSMPRTLLSKILSSALSWLRHQAEIIPVSGGGEVDPFFEIWDRLSGVAWVDADNEAVDFNSDNRISTQVLGEPGGLLALCLIERLAKSDMSRDAQFLRHLGDRATQVVNADCRAGLAGRVLFASEMAFLGHHLPNWVRQLMLPRLLSDGPEANLLRRAYFGSGQISGPPIHNDILAHARDELARADYADGELESAARSIMWIAVHLRLKPENEYALEPHELKKRLGGALPRARRWAAWYLWRLSIPEDGEEFDAGAHWGCVSGPILEESWPRDASLRCRSVSVRFAEMALGAGDAVTDAVQTVLPFISPFDLRAVSSLTRPHKSDGAIDCHPLAVLRLLDRVLGVSDSVIPEDLEQVLSRCLSADADVGKAEEYYRLKARLRRGNR